MIDYSNPLGLPTEDEDRVRKAEIEHILKTDRGRYWRDKAMQHDYFGILQREEAVPAPEQPAPLSADAARKAEIEEVMRKDRPRYDRLYSDEYRSILERELEPEKMPSLLAAATFPMQAAELSIEAKSARAAPKALAPEPAVLASPRTTPSDRTGIANDPRMGMTDLTSLGRIRSATMPKPNDLQTALAAPDKLTGVTPQDNNAGDRRESDGQVTPLVQNVPQDGLLNDGPNQEFVDKPIESNLKNPGSAMDIDKTSASIPDVFLAWLDKWWRKFAKDDQYTRDEDVENSRKYGQFYADIGDRFLVPGNALRMIPREDVRKDLFAYRAKAKEMDGVPSTVSAETAKELYRARLAAERSSLAALGFDPHYIVMSPKQRRGDVGVAGLYQAPKDERSKNPDDLRPDVAWFDANQPWAAAHESMHRGISFLRRAGKLPFPMDWHDEEFVVRWLMTKYFGDIELGRGPAGDKWVLEARRVVSPGQRLSPEKIGELEKAASELYYERRRPSDGEIDPDKPHVWIMGPH